MTAAPPPSPGEAGGVPVGGTEGLPQPGGVSRHIQYPLSPIPPRVDALPPPHTEKKNPLKSLDLSKV